MRSEPSIERLHELWADRATGGEDAADVAELRELRGRLGVSDDLTSLDLAAGILRAGFAAQEGLEEMPAHVQRRILGSMHQSGGRTLKSLPWIITAVAASLAVMVTLRAVPSSVSHPQVPMTVATASWADWDSPEVAGVKGEVQWSEQAQGGSMRFTGLPVNDPSKERYQLWIIDSRGMNQRISGGVFDSTGDETLVDIHPGIRVCGAQVFAITIERPEGVWVSDMSRRVAIAQLAVK